MARIETINFQQFDFFPDDKGEVVCKKRDTTPIVRLPQVYWDDGTGWDEVNIWGGTRCETVDIETVKRGMKDLRRYASYLESTGQDWRDLPATKSEQPLRKFRASLIKQRDKGLLASSTTTNGMSTVIQFYRFARAQKLLGSDRPFWVDRPVFIPFKDSVGRERTLQRQSSDLHIPNNRRGGVILEDGLLPLRTAHMQELRALYAQQESEELVLMLESGFFTGARLGTIITFTVTGLARVREDSDMRQLFRLPVGPRTGIATKFSVEGEILIPEGVLKKLKSYATSTKRLLRQAKSRPVHKDLLFLTRSGKPYSVGIVNRLVSEMRKRSVASGLPFMQTFKFHQTRATFGTWIMKIALRHMSTDRAIQFVADALLHKDTATTLRYVKFLEDSAAKEEMSSEFHRAFTGIQDRDWNKSDA